MEESPDLRTVGDHIEKLLDGLSSTADPRTYGRVEELLRLVSELYGGGLSRALALAEGAGLVDAFLADELLASLLVVHGLHPVSLAARVEGALEQVRPLLATHGGNVELLDLDDQAGAVRLRLLGSCDGCPSSAVTLQGAVERAIIESAPEIVVIEVDAPTEPPVATPVSLTAKPRFDECPTEVARA
ncbi:MAG: NifU family protein [Acidimicrobiales bacterium]